MLRTEPGGAAKALGWGVIATSKDRSIGERLQELETDLHALLEKFRPDAASVERLFYFRNATTIIPVAQARGVILLTLSKHGVPMAEYTPMQVKQALTGYGKADKGEIQQAVMDRLALSSKPKPDDAADGLALAVTHWQSGGVAVPV